MIFIEVLNKSNYSFKTRFTSEEKGTNPEELLAAAHAGCFTMAVSLALTQNGFTPKSLDTEAEITMDTTGILKVHLHINGDVDGVTHEEFEYITNEAKKNCLISKILDIPISSQSHLV